jgi:hypothetical protein
MGKSVISGVAVGGNVNVLHVNHIDFCVPNEVPSPIF